MSPDQRTRALERQHDAEPTLEIERALVRDLERRLGKRVRVGEPAGYVWAIHFASGKLWTYRRNQAEAVMVMNSRRGDYAVRFALYPVEDDE